jgi:uncharacterized membrane protein YbhN (UPF0104 family)
LKKVLSLSKKIVPLTIGIFFIYLSYQNTSPEDRSNIIKYIKNADYRYVLLSAFFGILSHLSRAFRWQYLLNPLGYRPKIINSTLAVLIGYLSNLGIPRSGELLRATAMDRYENIPFQKAFGTIIAERAVDLLMLTGFVSLALGLQYELIANAVKLEHLQPFQILVGLTEGICVFFKGIWEGISTLTKMKKKGFFVGHTLFIWSMYFMMFWIIKFAIPETVDLGLNALIPAFVVGGLSISATNGGIGVYPYTVSLVLIVFEISKESSLAFGWIMWSCQTLMVITFGALAFFALPLVNRQR